MKIIRQSDTIFKKKAEWTPRDPVPRHPSYRYDTEQDWWESRDSQMGMPGEDLPSLTDHPEYERAYDMGYRPNQWILDG